MDHSPRNLRATGRPGRLLLLALFLLAPFAVAGAAQGAACTAAIPSLGSAADCAMFEVGTGMLSIKNASVVDIPAGDLCIANGAKASIKDSNVINGGAGELHFGSACSPIPCGPGVTDPITFVEEDMSGRVADAVAFATAVAALPATQSFASLLDSSFTITGSGGTNVIEVSGVADGKAFVGIRLNDNTQTITLAGSADDIFVFNVSGDVVMKGTTDKIILTGGVDPSNVIWNIVGSGNDALLGETGANTVGMWVDISGRIELYGGNHVGPFITGNGVKVRASVSITGPVFPGCSPGCPSPEISGLTPRGVNIQTPSGPTSVTARNSNFYFSWFDPSTWEGHIEALRIDVDGTIIDAQDPPVAAIDPATNQLEATAVSYWDAGTQLIGFTPRKIYTTVGSTQKLLTTGNVSEANLNILASDLSSYPNYPGSGITTTALLKTAIINYAHGMDAFDEDLDTSKTDMRPFALGDVFHSNATLIGPPATPLYGEAGFDAFITAYKGRDWRLYAGSNDGMLHGFDAGESWDGVDPATYDAGTGDEVFGYVPGIVLNRLKYTPINSFRTEFFVDGSIVASDAWLGDLDSSGGKSTDDWATVMITGLRNGGRGYLALDVTDPSATVAGYHGPYPKLLWEFTHAKLGKSWSQPIITRLKVEAASASGDKCGPDDGDGDCKEQWVAIFSAGYTWIGDPNTDAFDPSTAGRGKDVMIVALDTGALLATLRPSAGAAAADMIYAIPATPAVIDVDEDGFADVIYVGDLGGQLWKWDVSAVGQDTAGDAEYDNWPGGVHFKVDPVDMGGGKFHYRSMFATPAAAYTRGVLVLALGTGERNNLTYEGDASKDDNNRFYVIPDATPVGASYPLTAKTESDLTNVTAQATLLALGATGFYFVAEEHEKFITDAAIFAGHVLVTSFKPDIFVDDCGPGKTFFYAFRIDNALGHFTTALSTVLESRRKEVGAGVGSAPRVKVSRDPNNDSVYVTTSEGEVLTLDPPARTAESAYIYWKQVF